ncbi:hypothetical protein [Streptomyces sp. NPDC048411]|uniref:hypothetical protein n=1 Tax=Streptomyces sp. NPDC048411 TaxID=3157206 RepID=UPI0034527731
MGASSGRTPVRAVPACAVGTVLIASAAVLAVLVPVGAAGYSLDYPEETAAGLSAGAAQPAAARHMRPGTDR